MKYSRLYFSLVFVMVSFITYGQNCSDYHNENCRWADESFLYSRQSKSALFTQGMTSEFAITVYGDEEYYISLKGEKKLGDIRIRVKEDNADKNVLYDNSDYKYEESFYFKNENSRTLLLEITSVSNKKFSNSTERYCIGVLIQFRNYGNQKTRTGF